MNRLKRLFGNSAYALTFMLGSLSLGGIFAVFGAMTNHQATLWQLGTCLIAGAWMLWLYFQPNS